MLSTITTDQPSVPRISGSATGVTWDRMALAKSRVGGRFRTWEGKLSPVIASSCGLTVRKSGSRRLVTVYPTLAGSDAGVPSGLGLAPVEEPDPSAEPGAPEADGAVAAAASACAWATPATMPSTVTVGSMGASTGTRAAAAALTSGVRAGISTTE